LQQSIELGFFTWKLPVCNMDEGRDLSRRPLATASNE
jgi:hypothetical protein